MDNYIMGARGGVDNFIHETCILQRPELITLGNHCSIDGFLWCEAGMQLGDHVSIGPHVSVIGSSRTYLEIHNFVKLGAGCRIICDYDEYLIPQYPLLQPVTLESFVTIGANAVIMPGVILREGTLIMPGSVVNKDTEPWSIYGGNPASTVGRRNQNSVLEYAKRLGYS